MQVSGISACVDVVHVCCICVLELVLHVALEVCMLDVALHAVFCCLLHGEY